MKRYTVRFTEEAEENLRELYRWLLMRDEDSLRIAQRALDTIILATQTLQTFPYACRKATDDSPYFRELLIPFGASGYVALFEIEPDEIVTILAVRHQCEADYH